MNHYLVRRIFLTVFCASVCCMWLANSAMAISDPRFFGKYCGSYTERISVAVRILGWTVWSNSYSADFDTTLNLDYAEPSPGKGFVSGEGTLVATSVPSVFSVYFQQGERIPVGLSGIVDDRGHLRGTGVSPARGSASGTADLLADGERLTIHVGTRDFRVSKAECGNEPPTAEILTPPAGTHRWGDQITFTASASDPEDGTIPPERLVWRSSRDGVLGNGLELGRPRLGLLSPGRHTITFTATDSGGRSAVSSVAVVIENDRPTANILAPDEEGQYYADVPITLRGVATDRETGNLTGSALKWVINRAEVVAEGTLGSATLREGRYEIRLLASDPQGATTVISRTISVGAKPAGKAAPLSITIKSPHWAQGIGDDDKDCLDLVALADDPDGNPLTPLTIKWSDRSDLGGEVRDLGTGRSITTCGLTAGTHDTWHTIRATASHPDSAPAWDEVRIYVIPGGLI